MRLLATLLVAFLCACACALTIPHPHSVVVAEDGNTLGSHHHLISTSKAQLEGGDAKSIDESVTASIASGDKKQRIDLSDLYPVSTKNIVTNRDDDTDDPPESSSTAEQGKQALDDVNDYNRDHPYNRLPTYVLCYHPEAPGGSPTVHHSYEILDTLNEAHRLRQNIAYLDRPYFSGTHYPHQFQFTDLHSQSESRVRRVDVGQVTGNMHMFPILLGGNIFVTGQHPFWDRVMFDDAGNYLGVMTWRGGWWWWCIPINMFDDEQMLPNRGASASGVPGVDEYTLRMRIPGGGWVDAANPIGGGSHIP